MRVFTKVRGGEVPVGTVVVGYAVQIVTCVTLK